MANFGFSLQVMVIGMVVVFTGLVILIGCIKLLSAILAAASKKSKAAPVEAAEVAPAPMVEDAAYEPITEPVTDDGELIAVISAAIAAFSQGGKALAVRSVRKVVAQSTAWSRAGRNEQIGSRF